MTTEYNGQTAEYETKSTVRIISYHSLIDIDQISITYQLKQVSLPDCSTNDPEDNGMVY